MQQQAHRSGQCHHLHGRHREDAAPQGGEALPERHAKSQSYQQQQGAAPARQGHKGVGPTIRHPHQPSGLIGVQLHAGELHLARSC